MSTESREDELEREWALQERALDAERRGEAPGGDARLQRYRAVARALREPVVPSLPMDFARVVARRAREDAARAGRFEQRFAVALVALLGGAGLFFLLRDGGAALASVPVATNAWVLALAACVGVSTLAQWWGARRYR
jgi:hypothetical protein